MTTAITKPSLVTKISQNKIETDKTDNQPKAKYFFLVAPASQLLAHGGKKRKTRYKKEEQPCSRGVKGREVQ